MTHLSKPDQFKIGVALTTDREKFEALTRHEALAHFTSAGI